MGLKGKASLLALANRLAHLPKLMDAIVDSQVEIIKKKLEHQFDTGTGPDGENWPVSLQLNEPLIRTGELRKSFIVYKGGSAGFAKVNGANWYFGVRSSSPYASIQHFGGTLPNGGVIKPHQIIPYNWPGGWGQDLDRELNRIITVWMRTGRVY